MIRGFTVKENDYQITLSAHLIGEDVMVAIYGGDRAHIGAVAISMPRTSHQDAKAVSATTSVFVFPGHKEDELAKCSAEQMAKSINKRIVLTCGIHMNKISAEDIDRIQENVARLVSQAVLKIKETL